MLPAEFASLLSQRRLILDGAVATFLSSDPLTNPAEQLCLSDPESVKALHRTYLEAGADILTTNSFSADSTPVSLRAARLAREVADEDPERGIIVAGSIGPLPGEMTDKELFDGYLLKINALLDGGADILLFETVTDLRPLRAGLRAAEEIARHSGHPTAIMVSATPSHLPTRLLSGESFAELATLANSFPSVATLGLNCGTTPEETATLINLLSRETSLSLSLHPNAGLPGRSLTPRQFAAIIITALAQTPGIAITGGCCGTTPAHIRALRNAI